MSRVRRGGAFAVVSVVAAILFVPPAWAAFDSRAHHTPVAPDKCINIGLDRESIGFDFYISPIDEVIGFGLSSPTKDPGFRLAVFIVPKECEKDVTLNTVIKPTPDWPPHSSELPYKGLP